MGIDQREGGCRASWVLRRGQLHIMAEATLREWDNTDATISSGENQLNIIRNAVGSTTITTMEARRQQYKYCDKEKGIYMDKPDCG